MWKILEACDLGYAWQNMQLVDITSVIRSLCSKYEEDWRQSVESMPKLCLYKLIKITYGTEEYLKSTNRSQRSAIAKMRMGVFPIELELGRYRHKPLEDRQCTQCDCHEVEDESHFLLRCEKYNTPKTLSEFII